MSRGTTRVEPRGGVGAGLSGDFPLLLRDRHRVGNPLSPRPVLRPRLLRALSPLLPRLEADWTPGGSCPSGAPGSRGLARGRVSLPSFLPHLLTEDRPSAAQVRAEARGPRWLFTHRPGSAPGAGAGAREAAGPVGPRKPPKRPLFNVILLLALPLGSGQI